MFGNWAPSGVFASRGGVTLVIALMLLVAALMLPLSAHATVVTFPDANLESAVRQRLSKPIGDITDGDMAGLTSLQAQYKDIQSLAGLEYAVNIVLLKVDHNQIADIAPLRNLTKLTYLELSNNQITDITSLQNVTKLTDLRLSFNQISDITTLQNHVNLTYLDLGSNQITDIAPLRSLTQLSAFLNISYNQISDITPLQGYANLKVLHLSNNQIADIATLQNLGSLTTLGLRANQISDVAPLQSLVSLTFLEITDNQVSNIAPLQNLTKLTDLRLAENQVSNTAPLQNLTKLTALELNDNQISDITPLGNLTTLTDLRLHWNQISDVTALQNLVNLTYLAADNNQIRDISPLQNLTKLTVLSLFGNQISDVTPLQNLTKLTVLSLFGNQISDVTPLQNLTKLTNLWLNDNLISDIGPLAANSRGGGLGAGDVVGVAQNYLDLTPGSQNKSDIDALAASGATVYYMPQRAVPATTLQTTPSGPNGDNGWFRSLNVTLTMNVNGTTYYQWDAQASGAWQRYSGSPYVPGLEGDHTLYFYGVDWNGYRELTTNSQNLKLDSVAPSAAIAVPASGSSVKDPTVLVAGTAVDAAGGSGLARVEVRVNPTGSTGAWQPASGTDTWSCTVAAPAGFADYEIEARAVDIAGNTSLRSAGSFVAIIRDRVPPMTTLTTVPDPPDGTNDWYKTMPQITLTRNEAGTTYYQWDDTDPASWTSFTESSKTFGPSAEGSHTLYYYSKDLAGNEEAVKNAPIRFDPRAPITFAWFNGPLTWDWSEEDQSEVAHITSQTLITFDAQDYLVGTSTPVSGIAKTEYKIGDGEWKTYLGGFTLPPETGYRLQLWRRSTDNAGNQEVAWSQVVLLNDPVKADDSTVGTAEDTPIDITMQATSAGPATYSIVDQPTHGMLGTVVGNTVTYDPAGNYNGTDSFTFKATVGATDSNVATVHINISPVNDAPVMGAVTDQTVDEGTSRSIPLTASDIDGIDQLVLSGDNLPSFASVTDNGDGTGYLVLQPSFEDSGTYAGIGVIVSDGKLTDRKTISITVNNVNRPPTAGEVSLATDEDVFLPITLPGSDPDVGDSLTYLVTSGPSNGTLTGTGSMLTYKPNGNWFGIDTVDYTVTDPSGASAAGKVTITVNSVNDRATAVDDAATTYEDVAVTVNVLGNDSDPEGDPLSVASVTNGTHGTVTNNGDGTVTYTPATDYNGTDEFTYTATDGKGGDAVAKVLVTVNPVDDPPRNVSAGPDQTVDERAGVNLAGTATDVDGDGLTYTWTQIGGPPVSLSTPNSAATSFRAPDVYENTALTFRLTVSDGRTPVTDDVVVTVRNVPGAIQSAKGAAGYWKNHPEHVAQILAWGPIDLGDTLVTDVGQAVAILSAADAKDARVSLRAHLLATILNLRNDSDPMVLGYDIRPVVAQAKAFLATHTSPIGPGNPERTPCLALKDKLEAYSNSGK